MITLLTYPAAFGEFSISPFCTKAAWLLNASGLRWVREDTLDPRKMPHGKLPAVRIADRIIADSETIRAHLETEGASFDAELSELDRANARAFTRMADEHLYFHLLQDRWSNDAVWSRIRDTFFGELPRPLRGLVSGMVRREVLKGLKAQGTGRFSEAERMARIEQDLGAIAARLWQGSFLFGSKPCSADASVAAMLSGMRATPEATALQRRISGDMQLCAYIDRTAAAFA
ncbi:glutathione S-transferase family protein [Sulfitobacter sp. LCG007]